MQRDEDEYKEWQDRYEDLKEEWDGDWSKEKQRDHLENMRLANEQYVSQATLSNRALRAFRARLSTTIQVKPCRAQYRRSMS